MCGKPHLFDEINLMQMHVILYFYPNNSLNKIQDAILRPIYDMLSLFDAI